jgi:hypothetical protein
MGIAYLISLMCTDPYRPANYVEACNYGAKAFFVQSGIERNVNNLESFLTKETRKMVIAQTGEKPLYFALSALTVVRQRGFSFNLGRIDVLRSNANMSVGMDGASLGMSWGF